MQFFADAALRSITVFSLMCGAALFAPDVAQARNDSATSWSEEDFALYPAYCRAKLGEAKALEVLWSKQLGSKNYLHIHHFCFGLKALNLAYASYSDAPRRRSLAGVVITNFHYILRHTEPTFFMRPEALVNLGRGHMLLQEYTEAREAFEAAIKINPLEVNAWVALSDLYFQIGRRADAMRVLEDAQKAAGEHKKITLRIEDLKKAGQK